MYKINKKCLITTIYLKFLKLLKKKSQTKNVKQTLIFLRSPKHFNIGKRKIYSFKYLYVKKLQCNLPLLTNQIMSTNNYFFKIKNQMQYTINDSYVGERITFKVKIKWRVS